MPWTKRLWLHMCTSDCVLWHSNPAAQIDVPVMTLACERIDLLHPLTSLPFVWLAHSLIGPMGAHSGRWLWRAKAEPQLGETQWCEKVSGLQGLELEHERGIPPVFSFLFVYVRATTWLPSVQTYWEYLVPYLEMTDILLTHLHRYIKSAYLILYYHLSALW
jgi:hypothetical protein